MEKSDELSEEKVSFWFRDPQLPRIPYSLEQQYQLIFKIKLNCKTMLILLTYFIGILEWQDMITSDSRILTFYDCLAWKNMITCQVHVKNVLGENMTNLGNIITH